MPEIVLKDKDNKDAGSIKLSDERFGLSGKEGLMHSSVVNYLANQRQGTHSTKGRSDVQGGGRKPYRQKGTGRARAGTIRSPLWRGGGTIFGPLPRDYYYSMPKKARRQALYAAVSAKIADGELVGISELKLDAPRTKDMIKILDSMGLSGQRLLLVTREIDANVALSARNIPGVSLRVAADLNAYDVLSHRNVLITKEALEALQDGAE